MQRKNKLTQGTSLGITLFNPNQPQNGSIVVGIIFSEASNTFCICIQADPTSSKAKPYYSNHHGELTIEHISNELNDMEKTINDLLHHTAKNTFTSLSIQFSHDNRCNLFSKSLTNETVATMLNTTRETTLQVSHNMLTKKAAQTCVLS